FIERRPRDAQRETAGERDGAGHGLGEADERAGEPDVQSGVECGTADARPAPLREAVHELLRGSLSLAEGSRGRVTVRAPRKASRQGVSSSSVYSGRGRRQTVDRRDEAVEVDRLDEVLGEAVRAARGDVLLHPVAAQDDPGEIRAQRAQAAEDLEAAAVG